MVVVLMLLTLLVKGGLTTTVEVIDFTEARIEDTFSGRREGKTSFK